MFDVGNSIICMTLYIQIALVYEYENRFYC